MRLSHKYTGDSWDIDQPFFTGTKWKISQQYGARGYLRNREMMNLRSGILEGREGNDDKPSI